MKKQKLNYVSPETETLVVRFEGVVCGSPDGFHLRGAGTYDEDDTNENDDY